MAMNKAEKAEMEALRQALLLARSLRETSEVEPDTPPPKGHGLSVGYVPRVRTYSYIDRPGIEPACSSSTYHAIGRVDKTTSQRAINLYSTPLMAWKAARRIIEKDAMQRLAYVDEQIAKLEAEQHE